MMRAVIAGEENPKIKLLSRAVLFGDTAILVYLALVKLVVHLCAANNYGFFGDELYFLDLAKHLDFGYVDVPPMVAYFAAFSSWLLGSSLFASHIFPAIAGALTVFMAGCLARKLGGGRFAQWFTALMVLASPVWLWMDSYIAYDAFDQLFVMIFLYLAVFIIQPETPSLIRPNSGTDGPQANARRANARRADARHWLILGALAGIGVLTKLTMLFTILTFFIAILTTPKRKSLLTLWPWLAALIALAICTPYLIWESAHGWPTLTFWRNYGFYRTTATPLVFLRDLVVLSLHPFTLPVWIMGLGYLWLNPEGKKYRLFGVMFVISLIYLISLKFESRMLVSAYFPLLAAGAIWLEKTIQKARARKRLDWLKPVYGGILLASGILLAPYFVPILPLPAFQGYAKVTSGVMTAVKKNWSESDTGLPFFFAFQMGWPEMVKEVADIYHRLPEADRKQCAIYTENYVEAAAIDVLGKAYGLPRAVSHHLSYHHWGPGKNIRVVIAFGWRFSVTGGKYPLTALFDEVKVEGTMKGSPYSVSWERGLPIYICRNPTPDFIENWSRFPYYY